MAAELFLDTNVLVYAFDDTAPSKQARANALIAEKDWVCSWQVVQEFLNVAVHKFSVPMIPADLSEYLEIVLWPKCAVLPSHEIFESGLRLQHAYGYRFYDSLILSSALASGASKLLSEDLQHGQTIGTLTISNPFL